MPVNRRTFLKTSAAAASGAALGGLMPLPGGELPPPPVARGLVFPIVFPVVFGPGSPTRRRLIHLPVVSRAK